MDEKRFNDFIKVRFIIPIKIAIGTAIMLLVNPNGSPEFYKLIADCLTYSIIICILYFTGDYVFYVAPKIYRRLTNKEDEAQ